MYWVRYTNPNGSSFFLGRPLTLFTTFDRRTMAFERAEWAREAIREYCKRNGFSNTQGFQVVEIPFQVVDDGT